MTKNLMMFYHEVMKAAIFLDHAYSYHPLKVVTDTFKSSLHPHCLSEIFQDEEFCLHVQKQYEAICSYFGASGSNGSFILTAGGKQAIEQMLDCHYRKEMFYSGKQQILITKADEGLFSDGIERLNAFGVIVEYLEVDAKGHVTKESLLKAITPRTSLVALSWANPLTGVIQPIADLASACFEKEVYFHVDASHVIGKLYFSLEDNPIDYLTFDAKPFHGPYQVGGLFVQNKGVLDIKGELFPLQIEALEHSLAHAKENIDEMNLEIARLRNSFEKKILEKIPSARIFFQESERLPHVSVIAFPYVASSYLLYILGQDRLYASIGGEGNASLETLLRDVGVENVLAKCALSFSMSYETTQEEIEEAVSCICKHYAKAEALVKGLFL